jgi:hypothetical protein
VLGAEALGDRLGVAACDVAWPRHGGSLTDYAPIGLVKGVRSARSP